MERAASPENLNAVVQPAPILIASSVTWASAVTGSMYSPRTVFVPPLALPISMSMFSALSTFVPVVLTGLVTISSAMFTVLPWSAVGAPFRTR